MSAIIPQTTFIYALVDPETQEIRYIGKANNPRKRFNKHLRQTDDTYKQRWIHGLQSRNLKPLMQIIEEIPVDLWQERERYWIDFYRAQGCHLTNTAPGGQAGGMSPEGRARLVALNTGKKHAPETMAKMQAIADTRRGIKRPPEVGAKVSAARTGKKRKPFSEEWRRNIGESARGRKHSPKSIEKMSLSRKRWHSMRKSPPSNSPTLWD